MSAMTKGERTELRSVIRNQFKVLRAEVEQRRRELLAEAERRMETRHTDSDRARAGAIARVEQIVASANVEITDALREHLNDDEMRYLIRYAPLQAPRIDFPVSDKRRERAVFDTDLAAQVKDALLRLDRQEADLLRDLSVGALETDEAQAFLSSIPAVGELVSATRLRELEAQFEEEQ